MVNRQPSNGGRGTSGSSSSSSSAGYPSRGFGGSSSPSRTSNAYGDMEYSLDRQNDAHVDRLHDKASLLKQITISMGEEIQESNRTLDTMGNTFSMAEGLLGSTQRRLKGLLNSSNGNIWCYMVLALLLPGEQTCRLDDAGSRECWQGNVPSYAVRAESPQDVQTAVRFAAERNLRLVVMNTGHDYAGRSTAAGALSVWTHNMKQITLVDRFVATGCGNKKTAVPAVTVAAGVQWGEVYRVVLAANRLVEVTDAVLSVHPHPSNASTVTGYFATPAHTILLAEPSAALPAWRTTSAHLVYSMILRDNATLLEQRAGEQAVTSVIERWKAVTPGSGSYVNDADPNERDWQVNKYGANYQRLQAIKRQVDPAGLFVCQHCVDSEQWTDDGNCRRPSRFTIQH
ncbi:hypothetical protein RI367_000980 [Sorochytrium milnesiophthora]